MGWAALIKMVYETDPLICRKPAPSKVEGCGGNMKIVSFIQEDCVIRRILVHCRLWTDPPEKPPPAIPPPGLGMAQAGESDYLPDYLIFDDTSHID